MSIIIIIRAANLNAVWAVFCKNHLFPRDNDIDYHEEGAHYMIACITSTYKARVLGVFRRSLSACDIT